MEILQIGYFNRNSMIMINNIPRFTCFAGETKALVITIQNEQENSEVNVAFVRGNHEINKSFSTKDGTLWKEEGAYHCELSSTDTVEMGTTTFTIEVEVEAPGGNTIRKVGTLEIKRDKVHKL